jgi:alkanesulfonate monooxygenase SsuD/methylene tetrahydromethanopterin reductase-like flavin-dependent oxidoreductase (luciferase family)
MSRTGPKFLPRSKATQYAAVRAPEAFSLGARKAPSWPGDAAHDQVAKTAREEMAPKNLVNRGLLCAGNPDTCIKALERFEELGVDLILCFMEMGRVPHTKSMESFKLFGKYVIPHFKGRTCWYTSQLQGAPHPAPPAAAGSK